jgi:hypothetical protein
MHSRKEASVPKASLLAILVLLGSSLATRAVAADTPSANANAQVRNSARPEIEKERQQAEQQAQQSLNQDAVAAIRLTREAAAAIAANNKNDALKAIEQAEGKTSILLARNPADALIPVEVDVKVIDTAPHDIKDIQKLASAATLAVEANDFPAARVILYSLMSEIHVRTYNLPLATYPAVLRQAARLLDQGKTQEAQTILSTALETLDATDRVTPLPLILARAAINAAQAERDKDKNAAQTLLETAKRELERSKDLGYAGKDPVYASLNNDISNLEKQLHGKGDTNAVFASLREKLSSFLNRESQQQRR